MYAEALMKHSPMNPNDQEKVEQYKHWNEFETELAQSPMFCPDCYKKNSHQQRNGVNPCNFFTCDVHKEKCCLMTTIFCGKCERRLCNTCIFNDKEHFDTFFK